jgi:hypothetical protein
MASGVTRDTILRSSIAKTLLLSPFLPLKMRQRSHEQNHCSLKITDVSHLNIWLIQEHEKEVKI